jgi:hypothetical protein
VLTGCTRDELIGAPFKNYFTEPERAEEAISRVLREGKVTNYELTALAREGSETVVSFNATTFHDRDRKLQGCSPRRATSPTASSSNMRCRKTTSNWKAPEGGRKSQPGQIGVPVEHEP